MLYNGKSQEVISHPAICQSAQRKALTVRDVLQVVGKANYNGETLHTMPSVDL